jgi:hypothetical protein
MAPRRPEAEHHRAGREKVLEAQRLARDGSDAQRRSARSLERDYGRRGRRARPGEQEEQEKNAKSCWHGKP